MQQHSRTYFAHRPSPSPTLGVGSTSQNSTYSEYGHAAFQIKGIQECSNIVEHISTAGPPAPLHPWGWCHKFKSLLFQNMVMLHIKFKGITNALHGSKYLTRRPPSPHQDPRGWGRNVKIQLF